MRHLKYKKDLEVKKRGAIAGVTSVTQAGEETVRRNR